MARRKPTVSVSTSPIPSDDPLDWLYLNPAEEGFQAEAGYTFGVLRKSYRGRVNSAAEFCRRKAQPVAPIGDASATPWVLTAAKTEVLLPVDADDRFSCPQTLTEEVDRRATDTEPALLTYITLAFPHARRLHQAWRQARRFAEKAFVDARELPVIQVLHAPYLAGSAGDVHCHLLIVPRTLDGLGLRGFAHDLCTDRGQRIIHDEWQAFRASQEV
jgi:hypothetical protein